MLNTLFFSLVSACALAAPVPYVKSTLPPLLQEVETKYAKEKTLSAQFTQITYDATLNTKKQSTGKIQFKRPNRVRWETTQPDNNLLISNGKIFWFYTPPFDESEKGQVIERKTSAVQSRLATALLSGSFSAAKDMKILKKMDSSFLLTPKKGTAGTVEQAAIEIDPKTKLIQKVTLNHKGGNRAEISLSQIELGIPLNDKLFEFVPPPGTDRVKD